VFHDVSSIAPGTRVRYRAVVLDNAGHSRSSGAEATRVAPPAITIDAPAEGAKVRTAQLRATAVPEQATHVVTFERQVGASGWTPIGTDDSSPVYSASDDLQALGLPIGSEVHYRAVLRYAPGRTVTSAVRTVTVAPPPLETAVLHYQRPDDDYGETTTDQYWGLHLWGDAIATGVETQWTAPRRPDTIDATSATFRIPLKDDTKPVNYIIHQPGGDNVPTTREPGGDRSFVPADHPEIWVCAGDATIRDTPGCP
jgi:hypothetical protein